MQRLLTATMVLALVGLASPARAQVGVDGIDARDGAPLGVQHVRQWTYVETRRCTITRHGGRLHRVCRVERQGQQPSWFAGRDELRAEIPPRLRGGDLPGRAEVGTPAKPRASKPALKLPRRGGEPSIELPHRHGAPAIVLPRRGGVTPPLAQLPTPYRPQATSRPLAKRPVAPRAQPAAPAAKPRVAVTTLTSLEAQVFTLLNAERKRQGKGQLRIDPRAVAVARAHSKDMCKRGYFEHRSPEGAAPWDRLRAGKVRFSAAGENIAVGYTTAAGVHRGWMNSPGHRNNRMNGSYTRTGLGMYNCNGKPYWTEVFMK
jgi:uncharacterized protein YkwD